jgi:hypothetical protein
MANYAFVENNVITKLYDELPTNWQNVSNFYLLKDDVETLNSLGWKVIQKVQPEYNPDTQFLYGTYQRIVDDQVIESQYVGDKPIEPEVTVEAPVELTEEQLLEIQLINHNEAMRELRLKRDELLSATDFTQLADVIEMHGNVLSLAYKQYRQSLRDLPNTYEFDTSFINISSIVFPTVNDFIPQPEESAPESSTPTDTPSETPTDTPSDPNNNGGV